jgi:hypothetical protein
MLAANNAFFTGVSAGLFPTTISAVLWLPVSSYTDITTTPSSGFTYRATVQAIVPYVEGMATNRLVK